MRIWCTPAVRWVVWPAAPRAAAQTAPEKRCHRETGRMQALGAAPAWQAHGVRDLKVGRGPVNGSEQFSAASPYVLRSPTCCRT